MVTTSSTCYDVVAFLTQFLCNILISGKIIKEMPGSVPSGTHCVFLGSETEANVLAWGTYCSHRLDEKNTHGMSNS